MHLQKTITLKPKPNQPNWDGVDGSGGGGGGGNTFVLPLDAWGVGDTDELALAAVFGGFGGHLRGSPQRGGGPVGGENGAHHGGLYLVPASEDQVGLHLTLILDKKTKQNG